ncbi:lysylphosphatidylglycerol synthase transmembrane domain-containing protein [Halohasta salina]|uniref:lysylphosphatidylglycerol synthase transmembrane domain-containing protein n=1 Tax=Halohasta salina TaxID=2961621 RepID=UPI0020A28FD6|nr:lysylphosphatidylglycerol synthase transmembrane domain-containing protein [Halohasta salina]
MHRAGTGLAGRLRAAATRRRLAILGTVAVFAGLVVAFRDVDVASVIAAMARADSRLLAAAVGLYALSWPLRGRRYGDVLAATGHPLGTRFLTLAVFLSQTANLVLPARAGDGVRAYVLQARRQVPYPAGFASLAVERVFDLAAIAVLGGLATLWLAVGGDVGPLTLLAEAERGRTALLAAGGVTAVTLAVGVSTVAAARSRFRPGAVATAVVDRFPRLDPLVAAVVSFASDVAVVARNPRAMVVVGAESLVVWALDVATAILVLAALDGSLAVGHLLVVGTLAVSVGNLAKVLPLSQGGIGLYEAAFTALVVALTPLGASTALAAAVVDHALKNAVTLVGGAVAIARLGVSPTEAAEQGTAAETAQ